MNEAISDFDNRVEEINTYFNFIAKLDNDSPHLKYKKNSYPTTYKINSELTTILKANGFLLLYNLVESTFRNSLSAVHEVIVSNNSDFTQLNKEIQTVWLRFQLSSQMRDDKLLERIEELIESLFQKNVIKFPEISIQKHISGNVDLRRIRDVSSEYGISIPSRFSSHGEKLLTIKDNRNWLAHGLKTFKTCGGDYTMTEMMDFKKGTISFLGSMLKVIEKFINNKKYLLPIKKTKSKTATI